VARFPHEEALYQVYFTFTFVFFRDVRDACQAAGCTVSVRFMLGGDHGKLKHGPPEGHSPVSESLMPKERLRIEPCFHLGNIPKGLVCGPAEVRDHTAFVPKPVDTSHVCVH